MPFCPKCRYEFEAGNLICPDCNVSLVDSLPPKTVVAEKPDDSWVVVGSLVSRHKSKVAKGSLDSNNIPSVIIKSQYPNEWGIDLMTGMEKNGWARGRAGSERVSRGSRNRFGNGSRTGFQTK